MLPTYNCICSIPTMNMTYLCYQNINSIHKTQSPYLYPTLCTSLPDIPLTNSSSINMSHDTCQSTQPGVMASGPTGNVLEDSRSSCHVLWGRCGLSLKVHCPAMVHCSAGLVPSDPLQGSRSEPGIEQSRVRHPVDRNRHNTYAT